MPPRQLVVEPPEQVALDTDNIESKFNGALAKTKELIDNGRAAFAGI